MERFGLVGLPNAGKSSLYNALTGSNALAAPYPFATKDPNIGVAKVLDPRLDALAKMSESKKVVNATIEVVDIGGLVEGASKGEGLGNKFLANIREVDAIVFVLRAFVDDDIPGPSDPLEHLRVVELELALADLESVETKLSKMKKAARMDRAQVLLAEGRPLYRAGISEADRTLLAPHFLLTARRVLAVVNVAEDALDTIPTHVAKVAAELAPPGSASEHEVEVLGMSVQIEAEAAQLVGQDRIDMLEALGLGEGALPRLVRSAYHLLGLRTFFTTGDKESRAWTFHAGAKAPECAGKIHTDLQRGFIRADVIHCDELLSIGSWSKARDVGKLRVEGKDYEVADGDVMEIRFNV
jgi:GTP-binding protein YchF